MRVGVAAPAIIVAAPAAANAGVKALQTSEPSVIPLIED
jgi:hypothetical protein